jgi:hypothetical protein
MVHMCYSIEHEPEDGGTDQGNRSPQKHNAITQPEAPKMYGAHVCLLVRSHVDCDFLHLLARMLTVGLCLPNIIIVGVDRVHWRACLPKVLPVRH